MFLIVSVHRKGQVCSLIKIILEVFIMSCNVAEVLKNRDVLSLIEGGGDDLLTLGFELEFRCPDGTEMCSICYGDGYEDVECPICEGSGYTECPECDGTGYFSYGDDEREEEECLYCDGTGEVRCINDECYSGTITVECSACNGEGCHRQELDLGMYGNLKEDNTVRYADDEWGAEFASYIMFYGKQNIASDVHEIMSLIEDYGGTSSGYDVCGLHIHVAPRGGWTEKHAEALARAWWLWAERMFVDEFPIDEKRLDYCREWDEDDNYITLSADEAKRRHNCSSKTAIGYLGNWTTRYRTLNFRAYQSHSTVEFRLFNGTTDPYDIIKALDWVAKLVLATQDGYEGSEDRFTALLAGYASVAVAI